jgi:hypothetical protein
MKINIETKIESEVLENIFVTALEGGSNYWYYLPRESVFAVRTAVPRDVEECLSVAIYKAVCEEGVDVPIYDAENEEEMLGILSMTTIPERLGELIQSDNRWALTDELNEEGDANSSDIVFQYLVMGEAIFG